MAWIWISAEVALAAHRVQLSEHGGADGVRDVNMLESAMARPLNLVAYGDPDAAELAASYALGLRATIRSSMATNERRRLSANCSWRATVGR